MQNLSAQEPEKDSLAQNSHYKKLIEFYEGDFQNLFRGEILKGLLDNDELFKLKEWVNDRYILPFNVLQKLIDYLNPYYENVINRLEEMCENPLEVKKIGGEYQGVLFGFLKFKRVNDKVTISIRKNFKKDANLLSDEDWVKLEEQEIIESNLLASIAYISTVGMDDLNSFVLGMAVALEFYQSDVTKLSDIFFSIEPNRSMYANSFKKYKKLYFEDESGNADSALDLKLEYISGLFAGLMEESFRWDGGFSQEYKEKNKKFILKFRNFIKKLYGFERYKNSEVVYEQIMDIYSFFFNSDDLIQRYYFLREFRAQQEFFNDDKAKLAFIYAQFIHHENPNGTEAFVLGEQSKNAIKNIKDDYFAYRRIISNNPLDLSGLKFTSKLAYKNFMKLDVRIIASLIYKSFCYDGEVKPTKKPTSMWRNFMYYLEHYGERADLITYESFDRVAIYIAWLSDGYPKNQINEFFSKRIGKAVDLFFQLDDSDHRDSARELFDYLTNTKFKRNKNGTLVKTRLRNLDEMNKKMTLKNVLKLENEWHLNIFEYEINKTQANKANGKSVKSEYTHLKLVDVVIDGVRFEVILNKFFLSNETKLLKHCIVQYHNKIKSKRYIAFSVTDTNKGADRNQHNAYTMGCSIFDDGTVVLDQLKGISNKQAPKKIVNAGNKLLGRYEKDNSLFFNQWF